VRAILNELHRAIEAAQDHLLIFQLCLGVWRWWTVAAAFSGALQAPGYAVRPHDYQALPGRASPPARLAPRQPAGHKTG